MRRLLLILLLCPFFAHSQGLFHKNKKAPATWPTHAITQGQISMGPPVVVNFTQLANYQIAHPKKNKKRFMEQGEDKEKNFKFHPFNIAAGSPTFNIPQHASPRATSPAPGIIFNGTQDNGTLIPPDIRGAAGPTYVMETNNQQFDIYTKNGTRQTTLSINNFFSATNGSGYFDPHVLYDANYGKFVVCIDGNYSNNHSAIFVAISQTSDPTGNWYVYSFDATGNTSDFLDYPLLGVNNNWVVVTGNDFLGNGGTISKIYVMNRASLYAGTLGTVSTFTDNNAFTLAPAHTSDISQNTEYLVQNSNGSSGGSGYMQICTITGTAAAPVYTSGNTIGVTHPWDDNNVNAKQSGTTNTIEDGDTRVGNAVYINGSMWFCHAVFLPAGNPTHAAVDWWQINPATLTVQQWGRIEDVTAATFYYYPSINVNSAGDALLGYCQSSTTSFVGAAYSFHAAADAANTMEGGYLYKAGLASYYKTLGGGRNRWGDYTCTAVDPTNNSFWNLSQFAATGNNWGTVIANISPSSTCPFATGLVTSLVTNNSATITWAAVTGAASYNLQYRVVGTSTWTTVNTTTTTRSLTGLTPGTNYEWQVQTVCTVGGSSAFTSSTIFLTLGPPLAAFTADVTQTCTGVIHFTDQSTGTPASWLWDFGDGTTSTLQNPTHHYFTNGTFTVTLTATNLYGNNTATHTAYITVNKPAAPATTGASRCGTGTLSLSSSSTDTIKWYANATDTVPVSITNPFVTPSITNTTTYYAEDIAPGTISHVGPLTETTLTPGGYYANSTDRYEIFNCLSSCTLKSVRVNAQAAGTRIIALRDANGVTLQSLSINLPAGVSVVTLNFVLPVQNNLQLAINGTANLYRNNGGGTYAYPYTVAGLVSVTSSNAGAGYWYYFYDWQIEGAKCVSLRAPVTATINPAVNVTTTTTNVTCFGAANGNVATTVTGGTPTFTYAWSNSTALSTAVNLAPGTYTVTVTDTRGCSATASGTISQPTTALSVTASAVNSNCSGTSGSVTAVATGGTTGYTYHWTGGQTTPTVSGLGTGTYSVTVTDAHNCTATASANITSSGALTLAHSSTNIACHGAATGSATATPTGTAPYQYHWSNAATTATINNLVAGTYTVTVNDAGGCSAIASITITEPATSLAISLTTVNTGCGAVAGSVTSTVTGGTTAYAYHWAGGQTTPSISNIPVGNYSVTVTDANSCTASASATVINSGSLSFTTAQTNLSCNLSGNGSATITPTNGTSPFQYHWSNNGNTATINNLSAGTYNVTMSDAGGCSVISSVTVTQPTALNVTVAPTNVVCGISAGSITSTVTGGTTGYAYHWGGNETTSSLANLSVGTYTVTVTDNNSCTATASTSVTSSGSITATASATGASCNGGTNGTATVTPTGTAPYVYQWSNSGNTNTISNIAAGNYSVTVTDANGCLGTSGVTVTEPAVLSVSLTAQDASCGLANGNVSSTVTGGTTGYLYQWSNATTGNSITNLGNGTYALTITDAHSCTASASSTVNATSGLIISDASQNISCHGGTNGTAGVSVAGGSLPLSYHWSTGANTSSLANVSAGTYDVTVTDVVSCTASYTVTVTEPAALQVAATTVSPLCYGLQTGSVHLTVTGGTSGYTYLWTGGAASSSLSNLGAGNYTATVTDANNCQLVQQVTVTQPDSLQMEFNVTNVACFGDNNGTAYVKIIGGTPSYSLSWSNGATDTLLSNLPAGNYVLTITDANGCQKQGSMDISQPASGISVTASHVNTIQGQNVGSASVSITGGATPYAVAWSNTYTGTNISSLAAGTYAYTVTDANGCSDTGSVVISATVGVGQIADAISAEIFPNPTSGELNIRMHLTNNLDNISLSLHDVLGRELLNRNIDAIKDIETTISLKGYAPGIYLVEIRQGDFHLIKKVILDK